MKRAHGRLIIILGCGIWIASSISVGLRAAPAKATGKPVPAKSTGSTLIVQGRVKAATRPPRPRSVPYKDAVIALRLTGVKALHGKLATKEIVVFMWGMRDNKWTPAASYKAGQVVKLQLTPWEKAERKYGRYNRFELQGNDVYALDTYWGEVK